MEVSTLPIAASYKEKLISAGFTSLFSIISVSASHLARELIIPHREALDIIKIALKYSKAVELEGKRGVLNGARTAWEMLSDEQNLEYISTGCDDLDDILAGGIRCGEVTEVGGVPGIGKTQLGIQLAVNVQIPASYDGLGAKAIYIDTEGSFMPERAYRIAEACMTNTQEKFNIPPEEIEDFQLRMQPKDFLDKIFYFRICSYTEQIAVVNHLGKFLEDHKDVKIVVMDSISFHFRQHFEDMIQRTNVLTDMSKQLMKLAKRFAVAVVLINHVTTKHTEGSFQLTLALGDTWSHSCTNRIILYWDGNDRYARIEKSPYLPSASVPFSVTSEGFGTFVSNCKRVRIM